MEYEKISKELMEKGVNEEELKFIINQTKKGNPYKKYKKKIAKNKVTFGVISDTHFGSINYNPEYMNEVVKNFNKNKVDFVCHVGDLTDGLYTNRPGQIYELNKIGADQQSEFAVEELSKIKQPLFFITGNHEGNTYFKYAGHDIGKKIEKELIAKNKDVCYLGRDSGEIETLGGTTIKLMHPNDSSSYAISYKSQKYAESLNTQDKPDILLLGHYHKSEYIYYKDIHIFQAGSLSDQSEFMKSKNILSMTGYWIITIENDKKGNIINITPTFYSL